MFTGVCLSTGGLVPGKVPGPRRVPAIGGSGPGGVPGPRGPVPGGGVPGPGGCLVEIPPPDGYCYRQYASYLFQFCFVSR